jgi:formylmethanofuran dehydrogenase subunit E
MGINQQYIKDLQKGITNASSSNQELSAGSGRRYEPSLGTRKHNERIHHESKRADHYKNLPFTFSKPPKARGSLTYVRCNNCGNVTPATTVTVGIICKKCNKFSSVTEVTCDR